MSKALELCGKKFGRLTVVSRCANNSLNQTVWKCKCDCGNIAEVVGTNLTSGRIKSFGCYKNDLWIERNKKHGMKKTRIYKAWQNMKDRCENLNNKEYLNYGGRGIKICPEWQEFIPFMEWSYANGYDENAKRGECTLDRIDVNGNYEPSNCRWATMKQQANNTRKNINITYNGKTQTLAEWSEELGINYNLLKDRIRNKGGILKKRLNLAEI